MSTSAASFVLLFFFVCFLSPTLVCFLFCFFFVFFFGELLCCGFLLIICGALVTLSVVMDMLCVFSVTLFYVRFMFVNCHLLVCQLGVYINTDA